MKKSMNPSALVALRLASTAHLSKVMLAVWFSIMASTFGAQKMSAATVTYIVGTCKSGTQFSTIQSALDGSPAPDTVEVCPGQYPEQITITKPVTLEGISEGNAAQARIVTPAGGLTLNADVYTGDSVPDPAAVQIYVKNVSGTVNLTNLQVNGIANGLSGSGVFVIGVLYQQTSGTINHVITSDQNGQDIVGWGIFLEGGGSKPSVTVENSSLHDFSQGGIWTIGTTAAPNLTAIIKNNVISSASQSTYNLVVEEGSNPTVTGNVVSGGLDGIFIVAPEGSVTGNTVFGSDYGIVLSVDGVMVKSNNIYGTVFAGIDVDAASLKVSAVENNTIKTVTNPNLGGGTGIELNCHNISSNQVHSNTLMDSNYGYGDAPAGFAGSNTYLGVLAKVDLTSCASGNVSKSSAAARRLLPPQAREQ